MSLLNDISGKQRLRAGMVGGGPGSYFGSVHRTAMRLSNRFDLVAGAFSSNPTISEETGKALALHPDRTYSNYSEMVKRESARPDPIDVAIIATPNHLHFDPCRLFLEAGIPVICEKPLVNSSSEARVLKSLVDQKNIFFAVTYTYTGYPMVRDARSRIMEGELGEIQFMYVEYLLEWLAGDSSLLGNGAVWRGDPDRVGATASLSDVGTHAFNLLEFVSGHRCTALSAQLIKNVEGFPLDNTSVVHMDFSHNRHGLLWASLAAPGHRNGLRFKIVGTKASMEWQQESPELLHVSRLQSADTIYRRGGQDVSPASRVSTSLAAGCPEGYLEALANLYVDYADALASGQNWRSASRVPLTGVDDGLRGVFLSELSVKSSATRSWVDFPSL